MIDLLPLIERLLLLPLIAAAAFAGARAIHIWKEGQQ